MRQSAIITLTALALAGCESSPTTAPTAPVRPADARAGTTEFVTTGGADITLLVGNFTERWSFAARRDAAGQAVGEFQVTFKIFGDVVTVHGDVLCFSIVGNDARLGGRVRRSSAAELVGSDVLWDVEDNGEGANRQTPDRATAFRSGLPGDAQLYCLATAVPPPDLLPVESGNVQVHQ